MTWILSTVQRSLLYISVRTTNNILWYNNLLLDSIVSPKYYDIIIEYLISPKYYDIIIYYLISSKYNT